jgi:hypothetical protein
MKLVLFYKTKTTLIMSSESIPVGLRSLLSKHYFLAQITSGQKPCMSNMTLVDASSWSGAFWRAWYGESRKTVMTDIENIISQTIDSIVTHREQPAFLRLIINALASTRVGLESMSTTYRNDPAMIGRLLVQLTNIDLQLEKHRDLIKGYKDKAPDEKIIDALVQNSDSPDTEGFRKFLLSQSSSNNNNNNINNNNINNNNINNNNNNNSSNSNNNSSNNDSNTTTAASSIDRIEQERIERHRRRRKKADMNVSDTQDL